MEHILALKRKYMKNTDLQLKELLDEQVKIINDAKNEQNRRLNEDKIQIDDLMSKVIIAKENLRQENEALESKNQDLTKHLSYAKGLEMERDKLLEEGQSLKLHRNKLKICKPNVQDQELLNQGRAKFALYKELTRIRWDYEDLKENVKGYVTNKVDYIHSFCYKNENTTSLNDLLWQEIYRSTIREKDINTSKKESVIENQ